MILFNNSHLFIFTIIIFQIIIIFACHKDTDDKLSDEELTTAYNKVSSCYQSHYINRNENNPRKVITRIDAYKEPAFIIDNIIDEIDLKNIQTLKQCISQEMPTFVKSRTDFNEVIDDVEIPSNEVTYMLIIRDLIPDLVNHIKSAVELGTNSVGWLPHPKHLGIRCIEVIEYFGISNSSEYHLQSHVDDDSVYTISILLSSRNSFTGGEFVMQEGSMDIKSLPFGTTIDGFHITVPQFSSVIFESLAYHRVEPVTSNSRVVLVMELWSYEDSDFSRKRSFPDDPFVKVKVPSLLRLQALTAKTTKSSTLTQTSSCKSVCTVSSHKKQDDLVEVYPEIVVNDDSLLFDIGLRELTLFVTGIILGYALRK